MFQWLLEKSLAARLPVLVAACVLMLYGAFQAQRLPVDVFPDLNRPTVTLMTEAGGMAPEEVEQLISFPLETALSGLPGVSSVRSGARRCRRPSPVTSALGPGLPGRPRCSSDPVW